MKLSDEDNGILVIDDTLAIHEDFRKILAPTVDPATEVDAMALDLFGPGNRRCQAKTFSVDFASQGELGVASVVEALSADRPYSVAFVDMRMPPGWDGVETVRRLWAVDPRLQIVICTAYSDFSWSSVIEQLGGADNLIILKKPFDKIEVLQLARALTEKWRLTQAGGHQLERLRATLADRTAKLVQAKETAAQADQATHLFLAPPAARPRASVIGTCAQLLGSELRPDQRARAEAIDFCARSLLASLQELRDFSRLETGRLELSQEPFDLAETVESVARLYAPAAEERGIELVVEVDPSADGRFRGDAIRLRQILINLVGNALKFTAAGEVLVRVRRLLSMDGPGQVEFTVSDTGPGIAPERQALLFPAPGAASGAAALDAEPSGFGLSICGQLIQRMRGSIAVESEPGRGSRFRFTIELPGAGDGPDSDGSGAENAADVRTLIVDDNAVSRASLSRLLTPWLSPPVLAASGREALDELQAAVSAGRPFRLVLIDQRLAGMDGLGLARAISRRPELGAPALVLLGSAIVPALPTDLAECGVALCVGKPMRKRELRAGIRAVLGAAGNRASSAAPTSRP